VHLQLCLITASKFACSWPPSAYLQTRLIRASRCICKLAWSRPPNVSPNSLDYGLQLHLHTCSIIISECISKFTQSWSPSVSPNKLDNCHTVRLYNYLITTWECMSELTWSRCCEMVELEGRQPSTKLCSTSRGIWREIVWKSGSGSNSVESGLEDMNRYPAKINHTNCIDLWMLGKSAWGTTQIAWIYESSARVHNTKSCERWSM